MGLVILLTITFVVSCFIFSLTALFATVRVLMTTQGSKDLISKRSKGVLITGCDCGIGLELAKYFHDHTKFTIICGFRDDISSDGFQQLSEISVSDSGSRLELIGLDITSREDILRLTRKIEAMIEDGKLESLFAVINNAGIMTYGEFDWQTMGQIVDQVNVNILGTFMLTRSVLPFIIRSGGRVINVSSVNDSTVFPGLSVYSATKSALSTFSRGLGYELRKFNGHVITIRLGDFARLTNIMTNHSSKCAKMWDEMGVKKRMLYGGYFQRFNSHLMSNYGMTSPRAFNDSPIFKDFRLALLAKNPPTTITCAPLKFKVFYFIVELIPVWAQYYLIDFLLKSAFNWGPQTQEVSTQTEGEQYYKKLTKDSIRH